MWKGKLLYKDDVFADGVELDIRNINTQEVKTINVVGGSYVYSLSLGKKDDILITVKEKGFAFSSFFISSEDTSFNSPSSFDMVLTDLEEGGVFTLDNVYFESNCDYNYK